MIPKSRLWIAGAGLVFVHLLVIGASFVAPYDPQEQNRGFPFVPPTRIRMVDSQARFHLHPFVCSWTPQVASGGSSTYYEDCHDTFPVRLFVRTETTHTGQAVNSWHLFGVDAPARVFLLGTDDYGRDEFSRLLHGGQTSLAAGLLAAGLSLSVSLVLGCVAGYFGSFADDLVMRTAELFMALPWIYLLFAVRAVLPLHLNPRATLLLLVSVIGITGWSRPSRLIRGVVLRAKENGYVLAARGFGVSPVSILRRHILPEVSSVALTQAALLIPQFVLAEVTLSFLGLGIGEPEPSWGNMLARLQSYSVLEGRWWMFAPGLALLPIFLLFYWFADSVQKRFQLVDLFR